MDCLVMPVQNKLEEWKKVASALDKDRAKGKKGNRSARQGRANAAGNFAGSKQGREVGRAGGV